MNPFALRLLLYAGAVLAAAGLVAAAANHERAIGKQQVIAGQAAQREADAASVASRDAHTNDVQMEAKHEADRFNQEAADGRAAAAAAADRVQQRFAAAPAGVPHDARAGASGPAAGQPDARADAFRLVVDAARRLAADADAEHAAGQLCERDYDALTP